MKVKELKLALENFDNDAEVARIYGKMRITTPSLGDQHRYITHGLIEVVKDDPMKRCLFLFEAL